MARPTSPLLSADTGRAQSAALVILAVLASLQVLLVFRSVWLATAADDVVDGSGEVSAGAMERGMAPPEPGQLAGGGGEIATGATVMANLSAPLPGQLAGMAPPRVATGGESVFSGVPVQEVMADPELAELLDTVRQLRPLGDTAGMLEVLRRCEGLAPTAPQVMHEFALTYEQMGLGERALTYWQRLADLGPIRAGELYAVAASRLQRMAVGSSTTTVGLTGAVAGPPLSAGDGTVLGIGTCEVVKDRAVTEGERAILRIPIQRLGEGYVEPTAVSVDVFFYDLVDGARVEQTRADPPISNWVAAPVDWSGDGVEPLDVIYSLPKMDAEEVKNHGNRSYHGYVVKLYYQNKLQATAANPPALLEGGPTAGAAREETTVSSR